jgi:Ca2+/Na+ antiporter
VLGLGWPVDLSSGLLLTLASFAALRDSLEALGSKLRLSAGALGSVITPVLTSTPKLMVVLCSIAAYRRAGGYDVTEDTVIGSLL